MLYVEDRTKRIQASLKKILDTDTLLDEGKITNDDLFEASKMLDWHINRTITDTKEQLKNLLRYRGVSQEVISMISSFHPRVYSPKPETEKVSES